MLLNYLKIAWKVLLRHPFYTFITLFGISLTLTVLMVLTSFLDHVFGTHYPETNRGRSLYLQFMTQTDSSRNSRSQGPMSFQFLTQYAKSLKTPEQVTICSFYSTSNTYVGAQKIKLNTKFTDSEFWDVMEFEFLEGKPYNAQNIASGDYVAVITEELKRQYFENTTEPVVGKTIELENVHYRVIGVVRGSPVTRLYSHADIYFPYTAPKSNYQATGMRGNYVAVVLAREKRDFGAIQDEFQRRIASIPLPGIQDGFRFSFLQVRLEPLPGKRPGAAAGRERKDQNHLLQYYRLYYADADGPASHQPRQRKREPHPGAGLRNRHPESLRGARPDAALAVPD
jgi:putative ABC transport system permease protein